MQGEVGCCITGPAFEYLLQQPDQALIQAVMLNCVAFTRMKAHQKGQLMELLGTKGLPQMLDGERRYIPVQCPLHATHVLSGCVSGNSCAQRLHLMGSVVVSHVLSGCNSWAHKFHLMCSVVACYVLSGSISCPQWFRLVSSVAASPSRADCRAYRTDHALISEI